jgi:hypothetical protein
MKRELRFQPDTEWADEVVIEFDEHSVSIGMEHAADLDEPPYYCERLARESLEADGLRSNYVCRYRHDWSNMRPWYDYGASVPTKVLRKIIALLDEEK